jgi:hypothetical protein
MKSVNNNNNNQPFYSQASWGRLEMKLHELKKIRTKQERKRRGKTKGDKKQNRKREKTIKRYVKKTKRDGKKLRQKGNKRKIKVLAHELLAYTLSYLMLARDTPIL